jgi:geranylgeranyl reductase family protein
MTDNRFDAVVIGAGPAGSTVARLLAEGGARVALIDHSHPREKTCGGGISARATAMFPELDRLRPRGRSGTSLRLVSPRGVTVTVKGSGQTFAIDREILDGTLLDRATAAGVALHRHRALSFERRRDGYLVNTRAGKVRARVLVGADGVHSLVRRRLVGPIPREHRAFGAHLLVPDLSPPSALIRFFGDCRGFAWVFNRRDRSSIGVGLPQTCMGNWRGRLASFFAEQAPGREMGKPQCWSLPQATHIDFFEASVAGKDWLLIGDAAGHVDPILGEGIHYAVWGATLAAEAVLGGHPKLYDRLWRDAYLPRFERHLRKARWLESGVLLDGLIGLARIPFVGARLYKYIGGQPHQAG